MTTTTEIETGADLMPGMLIVEQSEWYQVWLDTPISTPGGHAKETGRIPPGPDQAMREPGCCVKSKERAPAGWPKNHGRLQAYGEDRVIVASHASKLPSDPWFIWEGTAAQYHSLWDCD
jgi:hypothetical protein